MASGSLTDQIKILYARIEELLQQHQEGLGEYELLKLLQTECPELFPEQIFHDSHDLFKAHFLLFHVLYRLDDELRRCSGYCVEIDVLNIRLHAQSAKDVAVPAKRDSMREYYSDLGNLQQTSAKDVDNLLTAFWVKYYANERRTEALTVLGLCDPVEMDVITRRYRELAMEYHPDRGGEQKQFQKLQEAMSVLRRC